MMIKLIGKRIGPRIKIVREYRDWTLNDLAIKLKKDRGSVNNIELGNNDPRLDTVLKFADALECSIDYLLGRSEDFEMNTFSHGVYDYLRRLPSEEEKIFFEMAKLKWQAFDNIQSSKKYKNATPPKLPTTVGHSYYSTSEVREKSLNT